MTIEKVCPNCEKIFVSENGKKFCTGTCRTAKNHANYPRIRDEMGAKSKFIMPTGVVGAAHEMLVCYDLLRRGHYVFRAESPACPCDLIVLKNKRVFRVEVRTAWIKQAGEWGFSYQEKDRGNQDIIALVAHGGEVRYMTPDKHIVDIDVFLVDSTESP